MKVKILSKSDSELKLEIEGEGHTLCSMIQKSLLLDKRVELGGYNIAHPLTANPVIYVRTRGNKKPESVLQDAVKDVQKKVGMFKEVLEKALTSS